jgi:hypothetical protein
MSDFRLCPNHDSEIPMPCAEHKDAVGITEAEWREHYPLEALFEDSDLPMCKNAEERAAYRKAYPIPGRLPEMYRL